MRTRGAAALLLVLLLAACAQDPTPPAAQDSASGSSAPDARTNGPSPGTSTKPPASSNGPGTTLIADASDFGRILFGATGQAVYLFDVETTTKPRCYGACAKAWPPVLTEGAPVAGQRVDASLLGTALHKDGSTQVTYDGHPLYFYAHEGRHEVTCHDVFLNGGNWYAVQPDGQRAP